MEKSQNILKMIIRYAEETPDAPAILCTGASPTTYLQLLNSIHNTMNLMRESGFEKKDRVALVLSDGPEMAAVFLAVSATMTSAPLNPNYTSEEFKFYFSDLQVNAVVVEQGMRSAIEAAEELGIKVVPLELIRPVMETKDEMNLHPLRDLSWQLADSDDIALMLHTSGTTARPKIVPLTHKNICASIQNIIHSLQLTPADRCLNIMPLFHVHGLIGALLSTLAAGGSAICGGGFQPEAFFDSLERFTPTWYTAVPTMHHAILSQGAKASFVPQHSSLRFIRSCSAALPPKLGVDLENYFKVPVLEAYGMTEAAHQMTINPLPPGNRIHGSVGRSTGCEIAVMDETGAIVSPGTAGEIVVRGDNVIGGYETNPEANRKSFHHGWFRTGDYGYQDEEGYVYLNGRIKEIINRGGEKIFPREVDEVILRHPSVMQAAAFAVPHPTLGEEVAVVIVKRPDKNINEQEIRRFAAAALAGFKVPSQIIFANEIPKGPTGKIQRIGLADRLGLSSAPIQPDVIEYSSPQNEMEEIIASVWQEIFQQETISTDEDFFALGGNSIQSAGIVARIEQKTGVLLTFEDFFDHSTISNQAILVLQKSDVNNSDHLAVWGTSV